VQGASEYLSWECDLGLGCSAVKFIAGIMLTESYFTRTWSSDSSGFEDEDDW